MQPEGLKEKGNFSLGSIKTLKVILKHSNGCCKINNLHQVSSNKVKGCTLCLKSNFHLPKKILLDPVVNTLS